uniref:hypothetical protein n=1 Tax=Paractinoplanes polyasparticus TaxID=2856853 RepID=UPI001C856C6E
MHDLSGRLGQAPRPSRWVSRRRRPATRAVTIAAAGKRVTSSATGRRRSGTPTSAPVETQERAGQAMSDFDIQDFYRRYVEVINAHQWDRVGE